MNQQSCDAGDLEICDMLGVRYETGVGVTRDQARALSLFQRACDGEVLLGCTHLGLMYENGVGVTPDLASAVSLYERACDGGEMLGCANLGVSYERGEGVTQDPARAVSFYEQACGGGEMLGCTNLGSMYRTGAGVAQDLGTAVSLYQRACDGGMMESCANLAISYERGDGVTADVATAASLYRRACEAGVTWTCSRTGIVDGPVPGVASASGFRIATLVVDTETSDPLGEAIVDLPELGIRVITDGSGRVEFGELPRGRHAIKVERVGYLVMEGVLLVPGVREVMIPLDQITLGNLQAPGRVVGRVLEGGREYGVSDVGITLLTSPPV
ncbi:MAG: SEL1-like repeat protein, partial [Gemmatimonadetes bacterium]|nr:SEL1-like repeat protein [Gemmatimonadota bacterium]